MSGILLTLTIGADGRRIDRQRRPVSWSRCSVALITVQSALHRQRYSVKLRSNTQTLIWSAWEKNCDLVIFDALLTLYYNKKNNFIFNILQQYNTVTGINYHVHCTYTLWETSALTRLTVCISGHQVSTLWRHLVWVLLQLIRKNKNKI